MKILQITFLLLLVITVSFGQDPEQLISRQEAERIEKILSADDMQGRKAGTPGINKAADFLADEFKKAGLEPLNNSQTFRQSFSMVAAAGTGASGSFGKVKISDEDIIAITPESVLKITEKSGFRKHVIKSGSNFGTQINQLLSSKENLLVLIDTNFRRNFHRLNRLRNLMYDSDRSIVFVLSNKVPKRYTFSVTNEITKIDLANIVGVIPGRSRKDEYVIFSAHYDHLGIGKPVNGDSIFNGANDDAAGVTAVLMLAKYFKMLGTNERTLVFAAFTAEEAGGFGSKYFSRQLNPSQVVAMFNIEMIGTESKWGKNSAFITGYEHSSMGRILKKNLEGSGFSFHADPYPELNLFYRSDNATLAELGVPAHTISTSKMDSEKFYHTVDDEFETLDIDNMAMIIKAIAVSAKTIISGADTPTRVKKEMLR